ncbi:carbohydrate porin [Erythrobacter sp. CCH5-A1]|jgi:porin|uniref:carbohydrate porin n=1 Tax=Erythrobacter sp. CCH5-A1 TaxID=1768792 RepID=UPI0009E78D19|nr:carbohydrate porin [Erythrobacter sp. CCH5-A1]
MQYPPANARTSPALRRCILLLAASILPAAPLRAEDGEDADDAPVVTLEGEYVLGIVGVAQGERTGVRHVDLLTLTGTLDLEAAAGWQGTELVGEVIAGTGREPNMLAGTLQGIDNAEVAKNRVKLYQFYLAKQFADAPIRLAAGFIDLNAEFYSNEAAGLLMAPAFGIGSELAATGPNGPAIFPSTALTLMVHAEPSPTTYTSLALVNAESGVLGDAGGIPAMLREGALVIGEAGLTSFGKLALGAWTYTRRQDDLRLIDASGDPLRQRAAGAYMLLEVPFGINAAAAEPDTPAASLFLRAGISDGNTTPYSGGWQAGVLVNGVFAGRPDSQLSLGVNQAFLTDRFRLNEADAGTPRGRTETGFEITFADRVAPWLTLQFDSQYVSRSEQRPDTRDAVIVALRFILSAGTQR